MNAVFSKNLGSLLADVEGRVARRIPVKLIDPDLDQPRKEIPQSAIEERGNSLAAEGQLQPLELIEKPDGRYTIVFGEVRWRGAMWKGIAELEAFVHPAGIDPKKVRRRQLVENLQRQDMSAIDTANAIKRLVADEGSARRAAAAVGLSEAQISKYLAVLKLPPVASQLASGDVTRDIETLATVAKIERQDAGAAEQLMNEAKATGKLTRGRAREVAQAVNEGLKQKASSKGQVEAKGAAVKTTAVSKAVGDSATPVRVKPGERLLIGIKIHENHRDAKRFLKAKAEHGEPQLYQGGVSRAPERCWVLFGASPRAKGTDTNPRLQEFPCSAVAIEAVRKSQAGEV